MLFLETKFRKNYKGVTLTSPHNKTDRKYNEHKSNTCTYINVVAFPNYVFYKRKLNMMLFIKLKQATLGGQLR